MAAMQRVRFSWWGNPFHVAYTIVVFVVLASLDNAALAMIPSMVLPISEALDTSAGAIGVMTGVTILVTAITAVGWGYAGDSRTRKPLLFWGTIIWAGGSLLSATATDFWTLLAWKPTNQASLRFSKAIPGCTTSSLPSILPTPS